MAGHHLSIATKLLNASSPDPRTGCILWTRGTTGSGYGAINIGNNRMRLVHRLAWEVWRGPVPPGLCVCHCCDTPRCINIAHLFLGTHADNMADKASKGRARGARGEAAGGAKLTADAVRYIRRRHADGERQCALAKDFGVGNVTVFKVVHRLTWSHI